METLLLVAWLSGCWQISRGGEVIDEQWMSPRGGVMLGMARSVRGEKVVSTESTVIRVRDGKLVYEANPSGQQPTTFTASTATADRVVFENPQHDYPKRVAYERQGANAITAWIDDGSGGKRVEYPFTRAACGK
jgi:Domain of unknown function (DUF6265)